MQSEVKNRLDRLERILLGLNTTTFVGKKLNATKLYRKLNELSERVGVTPQNLSILKTGKAKAIRFSTLEGICKALECQPGDILIYNEEKE